MLSPIQNMSVCDLPTCRKEGNILFNIRSGQVRASCCSGQGTGFCQFLCPGQGKKRGGGSKGEPPALVPLSYFSFQPVLHDWCKKEHDMYYPVCGMMHIKEPLLLIGKCSLCGSSGFPLSLSEWSFTICPMQYNHK